MNSTAKGDRLENQIYQLLLDQKNRGELIYDLYPSEYCEIFKKKSYYCSERKGNIQFDVVVEVSQKGRKSPSMYVVFECKNHQASIQERDVTDFSSKLFRIFGHAAKGVLVTSSRLQSGAENVARGRHIAILKYDVNGIEIVADRRSLGFYESRFLQAQVFQNDLGAKALKFSAYYDGRYFGSTGHLLSTLISELMGVAAPEIPRMSAPFLSDRELREAAQEVRELIRYSGGAVDLGKVCENLGIELEFRKDKSYDNCGIEVLGYANFDRKMIVVNHHDNYNRKRFTVGHEIGHFRLNHGIYMHSEYTIEKDLIFEINGKNSFNYRRLEYQANMFASELLLPDDFFIFKLNEIKSILGVRDRGYGFIYVDDEQWNKEIYSQILQHMSAYFDVSKVVVENKLMRLNLINDNRRGGVMSLIADLPSALRGWRGTEE
ncbi:MAG: ImmA/IrrE family metallo-endopeptidase [Rhizobiaceae bacterium]|nr:ImmA/IrrE family metallo-endopeptidase [Rhizobiaceae bacterium]